MIWAFFFYSTLIMVCVAIIVALGGLLHMIYTAIVKKDQEAIRGVGVAIGVLWYIMFLISLLHLDEFLK